MSFEELARGAWLEGMALDGEIVWVSDVIAGGIWSVNGPHKGKKWREGELWIGALLVNEDGKVLNSGGRGLAWFDPNGSGQGVLVDAFEGKPIRGFNEMAPDREGGMIFGTVDIAAFETNEAPGPSQLYHIAADKRLTLLEDGLKFTNGLAFSADQRQLYHCETFVGVFAYDWDGTRLSNRRKLLDKDDADGMKVDVEERIWVTGFRTGELTIISPEGGQVDALPLPADGATNLWFGGDDGKDLYVTAVKPVPVSDPSEITMPTEPESRLLKGRAPVAGLPIPKPKFRLE
jgi:sugar lactone lactonase YvrE